MKKLALLFGALSLVSSVAYAKEVMPVVEEVVVVEEAPMVAPVAANALRVTNIGQKVTVENPTGGDNVGLVKFDNYVNLAYADWTFGLAARKHWDTDTKEGMRSNGYRVELGAMKHFENFALGLKWSGEDKEDKYILGGSYEYDMLSGEAELTYISRNGRENEHDAWELEMTPVALTYMDVTLSYYVDIEQPQGPKTGEIKRNFAHEVRLSAPLYAGEKLGVNAEYRYRFRESRDYKGADPKKAWYENRKHVVKLGANYKVTDAFSVNASYRYDFNRYTKKHNTDVKKPKDYKGEVVVGWDYKF